MRFQYEDNNTANIHIGTKFKLVLTVMYHYPTLLVITATDMLAALRPHVVPLNIMFVPVLAKICEYPKDFTKVYKITAKFGKHKSNSKSLC